MNSVIGPARLGTYRFSESRPWLPAAINGVLLVAALVFLFTLPSSLSSWRVGQVAGETVVAQSSVTFTDHAATLTRRKQAMAVVPITYRFDSSLAQLHNREASAFLSRAQATF